MEFIEFKKIFEAHVARMLQRKVLFEVEVDKDALWELYLDSFPPGTNEIFRKRREHDCSCCRSFIKQFGGVVGIDEDGTMISVWDFDPGPCQFQPVVVALSAAIHCFSAKDIFLHWDSKIGVNKNFEELEGVGVRQWDHFFVELPPRFVVRDSLSIPQKKATHRDTKAVLQRSLEEISISAIETVLDLISQNSLYKGEEWRSVLEQFKVLKEESTKFQSQPQRAFANYCWVQAGEVGPVVGRIKNHSIGTLLMDLSEGMEVDEAVRRYEKIVAPTNYKRPKAVFTAKMIEQAQQTIEELGLVNSLSRRFAQLNDITVNDILFVNRDCVSGLKGGDVFSELRAQQATTSPKKFDRVEEISAPVFITEILPRAASIEVFFENRHAENLVSLIAPRVSGSPSLFKWNNGFSWAYKGNTTDSMKELVKKAGGKIDGDLRFSIRWDSQSDLDAHCFEPNSNHIYHGNKMLRHSSSGMLDVDIMQPAIDPRVIDGVAVENIVYSDQSKMPEGVYQFRVHCFSLRSNENGFTAEIEFDGQVFEFSYPTPMRQGELVEVAQVGYSKTGGFSLLKSLPIAPATHTHWGIQTGQFHPVTVAMYSPNYWEGESGIGHRHYLFMLAGGNNDSQPNGFFNEFLPEHLLTHKRVFEALGTKMKVADSPTQLSGLGFSATKRGDVICKVTGRAIDRLLRVKF
jgi:hypothetical protein